MVGEEWALWSVYWPGEAPTLLSDAEGAEDQVEDVVGGRGAGHLVQGTEGTV